MLRAYLQGAKLFGYGFKMVRNEIGVLVKRHKMHVVLQS